MTSRFVWHDLNTKDLEGAIAFYTQLFGWNTIAWKPEGAPAEMPPYTMIAVGDRAFGGIHVLPPDAPAPPHWMGHVFVNDLDAAMERAKGLGAQFPMGAMDIPTVGRFAVMMDPQGCVASLFTSEGQAPPLPEMSSHGMVGWDELIASDTEAAKTFYSEVVGWKWRKGPFDDQMPYDLFGTGEPGGDAGGMMKKTDEMPSAAWFLYFTTSDIAATVARVTELGGAVHAPPFEVPTVGQLAVCASPDGAMFGVAQWSMGG